jgi:hypothetical protein
MDVAAGALIGFAAEAAADSLARRLFQASRVRFSDAREAAPHHRHNLTGVNIA